MPLLCLCRASRCYAEPCRCFALHHRAMPLLRKAPPSLAFAALCKTQPRQALPLQRFQLELETALPPIAPLAHSLIRAIAQQVAQERLGERPGVDFQAALEPRPGGQLLASGYGRARALRRHRAQRPLAERYRAALGHDEHDLARLDEDQVVHLSPQIPDAA